MDQSDLTPQLLLRAYAAGVFPMAESRDADEVYWVDPRWRGVIPLGGFHLSRSLRRRLLHKDYEIAINADFAATVSACADRSETWINDLIFGLYGQLHALNHAHSLEVRINGELAGGVYGVVLGSAFFGESMFSRQRDGSKIALAYLVARLRDGGFTLFDTQFITPHLASLGGQEISRAEYHDLLARALEKTADFRRPITPSPQELVHRLTQTS